MFLSEMTGNKQSPRNTEYSLPAGGGPDSDGGRGGGGGGGGEETEPYMVMCM